jgi:hypothetical protein
LDGDTIAVWSYGADDSLSTDLGDHLVAWDDAGRPSTRQLHMSVYRPGAAPEPTGNGLLLHRQWSDGLLWWSPS